MPIPKAICSPFNLFLLKITHHPQYFAIIYNLRYVCSCHRIYSSSLTSFLAHRSSHADARLPVRYHHTCIVRLSSLRRSLHSDVPWQNHYKGIYVVLWYLLFRLCQLPNTTSHIPQNHAFQNTHFLLFQTVDARSTYLSRRSISSLFY